MAKLSMSGDTPRTIAGAMSGTSADGVDVALVRIEGRGVAMQIWPLHHHHEDYPPDLRARIYRSRDAAALELRELAQLGRGISLLYAAAVRAALSAVRAEASELAAIAAHGQTLFHDPPNTIQWLDPALLAAEVGCAVVSDFRRADCAAGGQGAPLVPFADYVLFRDPHRTRVLLNIGGIANITHLPAGCGIDRVTAFDTGPGNCISDALLRQRDPGGPGYDADGAVAARGAPIDALINQVLAAPYFTAPPPKSTDGPAMLGIFRETARRVAASPRIEDLLHSACLITARSIADAIHRLDQKPAELIASGGGTSNRTLMGLLRTQLGNIAVRHTDDFGIPSAAKEAIAFALLGAATMDGVPSNVPSATGASRPVVLGSITPRPA